jgi:hypothetical protein
MRTAAIINVVLSILIVLAVFADARAQGFRASPETMQIEDQPGYVPDPSAEQLSPAIKWTAFGLINAEELGVSSKSIDQAVRSDKPEVRRLAGAEGGFGEQAGLTKDWVVRIIRSVGNYGEIFERNIGVESKLGIPRGLNQLWSNGGIVYAPPIR